MCVCVCVLYLSIVNVCVSWKPYLDTSQSKRGTLAHVMPSALLKSSNSTLHFEVNRITFKAWICAVVTHLSFEVFWGKLTKETWRRLQTAAVLVKEISSFLCMGEANRVRDERLRTDKLMVKYNRSVRSRRPALFNLAWGLESRMSCFQVQSYCWWREILSLLLFCRHARVKMRFWSL